MNWINVNDKLPEVNHEVLVYSKEGFFHLAHFKPNATYKAYYWDCDEYGLYKEDVEYWAELIKPQ